MPILARPPSETGAKKIDQVAGQDEPFARRLILTGKRGREHGHGHDEDGPRESIKMLFHDDKTIRVCRRCLVFRGAGL